MDIENLIDYYITQIYFANIDFGTNNIRIWRYNGEEASSQDEKLDGRWRWMLFDTDYGFGVQSGVGYALGASPSKNMLESVTNKNAVHWSRILFTSLIENEEFKETFITRFNDLLNTAFLEERILNEIDAFHDTYKVEMREHINRWGHPANMDMWEEEINVLKDFAEQRPTIQREQIEQFFQLSERVTVKVEQDVSKGYVVINSIDILDSTPGIKDVTKWSGEYYKNIPISVQAIPKAGYKFVGWEHTDVKEDSLTINLTEDIVLSPKFQ
ncbi:CotH kinase family protein [Sutcliffiella cohnii]